MGFLGIRTAELDAMQASPGTQWKALKHVCATVALGQGAQWLNQDSEPCRCFFADGITPEDMAVLGAIATDLESYPDFDPEDADDVHAENVEFAESVGIEAYDAEAENPWQAALDAQGVFPWLAAGDSPPGTWTEVT
jgi:hypothetical protein